MRVQMKTKIGGYRDGVEWPAIGGTIDVPAHEAEGLIANGYAEPAEETDDADQNAELADDASAPAGADGDAAADADGDGAADAGTEADTGNDEAAQPAPVTPAKTTKKR